MENKIITVKGYDFQIGILVCEMLYVRNCTFELTKNLSICELDYNFDDLSNSIGTLLLHISALEFKFNLNHFLKRPINNTEYQMFNKAMPIVMDKRLIYNNELEFYIETLEEVRNSTLKHLKKLNDQWLFEVIKNPQGKIIGNNFYLIKHILNDEINHQGQIKLILKRLRKNNGFTN